MVSTELTTTLDELAAQARMCVMSARMDLLQLGRVLTEAKTLIKHGEWEDWVRTNADMSVRSAQGYMQAYATFGLNPDIASLGMAKTMKLLPLSEKERETLFAKSDVKSMSSRELDEAIREQKEKLREETRAEFQNKLDIERKARQEAERKAAAAESRPPEIPKEMQDQLDTVKRENARLKMENKEQAELMGRQQEDYNRIQEELLNVKSSIAKGDAERVPLDQLTPDAFATAVRSFIGTCARMPHMSAAFAGMDDVERQEYDELLKTIESWAAGARKALDSVVFDWEAIVNG